VAEPWPLSYEIVYRIDT